MNEICIVSLSLLAASGCQRKMIRYELELECQDNGRLVFATRCYA